MPRLSVDIGALTTVAIKKSWITRTLSGSDGKFAGKWNPFLQWLRQDGAACIVWKHGLLFWDAMRRLSISSYFSTCHPRLARYVRVCVGG
jgi:hypothetical protein